MKDHIKNKLENEKNNKSKIPNHETIIPSLTKVKDYLEKISREEFKKQVNYFMKSENLEKLQLFLYYLMLFRELENVRHCLNDEEVPIEFIEKLIMFILGYCSKYNYSAMSTIDIMVLFLSEKRLLELIQKSKFIKGDKLLMFHILTRLDKNSLDIFFDNQENLIDAISSYYKLPEDVMTSVISRNRKFFDYIMMRLMSEKELNEKARLFISKFEKIIKELKTIGHILMKYHSEVDLTMEGKVPFNERDMTRISFLVNTIRAMPNWEKAVDYFSQGGVFVDEQERQIVYALIADPVLKTIFLNGNDEDKNNKVVENIDKEKEINHEENYFDTQAFGLTS